MIVLIPYTYPHNNFNCDFIIQTAKALSKKKIKVVLSLYNQPKSLLWHLKNLVSITKNYHPIFDKFSDDEKKYVSFSFPPTIRAPKRLVEYLKKAYIKNLLQRLDEHSILWMFNPQDSEFLIQKHTPTHKQIYDCVDHFTSLDSSTKKIIEKQESVLVEKSQLIFVNSSSLHKKFEKLSGKVILVPQGFDLETAKNHRKSLNSETTNEVKRICFVGTLSYRIDFKLLLKVIKNNPTHSFLLPSPVLRINPEHNLKKVDESIRKLKSLKNIEWIPQLNRTEILDIIHNSDICIIPYDVNYSFNKLSYPMKLFEYFYLQKPVISTPILELTLPKFKGLVYTGKTGTEWQSFLDELVKKPWPFNKKKKQQEMAIANNWSIKVSSILSETENIQ